MLTLQSSRNAMDNASKNASDMISRLQMQYNRGRQAAITNELVDTITGQSRAFTPHPFYADSRFVLQVLLLFRLLYSIVPSRSVNCRSTIDFVG